ncbi:MAG: hypothetical protein Q7T76_19160 [Ferruginibacter sp.]|nr:hypothetical protein [Ferruginibacter sp.]
MTKTLLILTAVILFIPNLLDINLFKEKVFNQKEQFDVGLGRLNSLPKLSEYIDSLARESKVKAGSFAYVSQISNVVRRRFFHGYSHFSLNENWIAAVSGKLIEQGLGTKVQPGTILNNPNAACSQQAIVMMALLRNKNIPYRHLGFDHHYALDVLIAKKWYFFDPNMEPVMTQQDRSEDHWKYQGDSLKQYYKSWPAAHVNLIFGNNRAPLKGAINEVPAPNARLYQATAGVLSKTIWILPLLLLYLHSRRKSAASIPGGNLATA